MRESLRLIALVAVAVFLAGCVSATVPMVKDDMSSFDRDNYECYRERRESGFAFGPPAFMLGHRIRTSRDERENYILCMRARGYHAE